MAGYDTRLNDANADVLATACDRIQSNLAGAVARGKMTHAQLEAATATLVPVTDLQNAIDDADLVIEAIVEDLAVKRALFQQLDGVVSDETILATNTSSLSVARIAEATKRPARVVGMHFFNPVHIMKLVEVVTHPGSRCVRGRRGPCVRGAHGQDDDPCARHAGLCLITARRRPRARGDADARGRCRLRSRYRYGDGARLRPPDGSAEIGDLVGLDVRLKIAERTCIENWGNRSSSRLVSCERRCCVASLKKTGRGFYEW